MAPSKILRWNTAAVDDLEAAHKYLLERNPEAACRFAESILDAAERLVAHPEIGPIAEDLRPAGRYRSWISGRYRLVYRVDAEVVWLLRVWDTRRDPLALTAPRR